MNLIVSAAIVVYKGLILVVYRMLTFPRIRAQKKAAPSGTKARMKPPDKIISSNLHITIFLYL